MEAPIVSREVHGPTTDAAAIAHDRDPRRLLLDRLAKGVRLATVVIRQRRLAHVGRVVNVLELQLIVPEVSLAQVGPLL